MRLLRFGAAGAERPGMLDDDGRVRDLSSIVEDLSSKTLSAGALETIAAYDVDTLPVIDEPGRLGPPVANVGKIICVGLNYFEHARESSLEVPEEPILFAKATSAICGPRDPIMMPRNWSKVDWEVELAVVIGKTARYVDAGESLRYVAGYAVGNDLSERAFQLEHSGQWIKGKSFDTSAPLGPWLVTADEVPDPQALDIWCAINGRRFQDSNTSHMIFPVAELISYITRFMTLEPGDVILSGTPPGVGLGQRPEIYLKPGDTVQAGISGLGEHQQAVTEN